MPQFQKKKGRKHLNSARPFGWFSSILAHNGRKKNLIYHHLEKVYKERKDLRDWMNTLKEQYEKYKQYKNNEVRELFPTFWVA